MNTGPSRTTQAILIGSAVLFWVVIEAIKASSYDDFCFRIGHDIVGFVLSIVGIFAVTAISMGISDFMRRRK